MLDERDYRQIGDRGMTVAEVEQQLLHFREGFPPARLARPATVNDGILRFSLVAAEQFTRYFDTLLGDRIPIKFVPASGAATRMFKDLFEFRGQNNAAVTYLLKHLDQIAFYEALAKNLEGRGKDLVFLLREQIMQQVLDAILMPEGLNYAALPKGLLLFHRYAEGARTAAEEHLVEAAHYATDRNRTSRIHFTVSPEHLDRFRELFSRVTALYEERFGVTYEISFSTQRSSTDTLAVDGQNEPFRNPDGSMLFRPGGHGSLLSNLNDLEADLIFVKNIDNIVPDRLKAETYLYKKVIGGILLEAVDKIHRFLLQASEGRLPAAEVAEMASYAKEQLMIPLPGYFATLTTEDQQAVLVKMLNRPIRVCGMVRNEGEPGGGPFWVEAPDGTLYLQIIESSQVDQTDAGQKEILGRATHFNPVDLVCSTRDYMGRTFDLRKFVDESTGFIAQKSSGGRMLKALERPGLWNGAMAGWITVFVEVPIITFNPVKTVNDLLRPEHLPA